MDIFLSEGVRGAENQTHRIPTLAYPNFSESFILQTDASLKGLGTELSQRQ